MTRYNRTGLHVKAAITALLAIAMLTAMPALGDVLVRTNVIGLDDSGVRDDARLNEVFTIKHQCSEVPVLIHAQRRTTERMIESCQALKWADDRFHELMQTNPAAKSIRDNWYGTPTAMMEMFVVDFDDEEYWNHLKEFWNLDRAGYYLGGVAVVSESIDRERNGERVTNIYVEVHEYVHHLQFRFVSVDFVIWFPLWLEGLAQFITLEYIRTEIRNDWYGSILAFRQGSWNDVEEFVIRRGLRRGLPHLSAFLDENGDQWQDLLDEFTRIEIVYDWGAWFFRFLVERHHAVLLNLKEFFDDDTCCEGRIGISQDDLDEIKARVRGLVTPLNEDWLNWHQELTTFSVAEAPAPIVLIRGQGGVGVNLRKFFRTINELAFEVSPIERVGTDIYSWSYTPPNVFVSQRKATILQNSAGWWEFTITATNFDGQSAELPFTVIVVEPLVFIDPLSTEEGQTVMNLTEYLGGQRGMAFTVESADRDVATAAVTADGRLVVTAVAPGKAEITLGMASGRYYTEQTFTMVVNDECPPSLCRGFFSGWRKLLL